MDKQLIETTLKKVKENSPKKNFKQSVDLIINLKGLDLKKAEHNVNIFITLQHDTGKKVSVCALVGPELEGKAKEVCEEIILADQFDRFKSKAEVKKLANKHDFFIAQAPLMPRVATIFGRYLGPRGKMPSPKIGSILPPNANVKQVYDRLKKTVNLATKNEPTIKCRVGREDTENNSIIDNILAVYNSVTQKLPNEKHNVKSVMLKLTMGPSFVIGEDKGKQDEKDSKTAKGKTKPKEEVKPGPKIEKPQEVKEEPKKESKPKKLSKETKENKK